MGDINVFSGPMKSGKTEKILSEYKRQLIAGRNVIMFKPSIDTRGNRKVVASKTGIDIPAVLINNINDIINYDADVYCIDEFQFLPGDVSIIQELADKGKKFFIAGLNLTSEKKPFGKMADLMCISDNVVFCNTICDNCKNDKAVFTYYKGKKDTEIKIGDKEYISLCRSCYELKSNKK